MEMPSRRQLILARPAESRVRDVEEIERLDEIDVPIVVVRNHVGIELPHEGLERAVCHGIGALL